MRSKNDTFVLQALNDSSIPLTAYELLDILREKGISAPPTVYRSLSRLMEKGFVHRIASLNAYSPCPAGHDHSHASEGENNLTHVPILFLCRLCRKSQEVQDMTLTGRLRETAQEKNFKPEIMNLEILGVCGSCH